MLDDNFILFLQEKTKNFIKNDRRKLLEILNNEGKEALEKKLKNDIKFINWKVKK